MKFLIKIEEAINNLILNFIEKIKHAIPKSFFTAIEKIKCFPPLVKKYLVTYFSKIHILFLKAIGFSQNYTTMLKGYFVGLMIYLKSNEFKQRNKLEIALSPIKKIRTAPIFSFSIFLLCCVLGSTTYFIYINTSKIINGTKKLRSPASSLAEEEHAIIKFTKIEFETMGKKIFLDVTITANSLKERDLLIPLEHELREQISAIHVAASQLPLSKEDIHAIEKNMLFKIANSRIKSVEIKQVLEGRPKYFMQIEKMVKIQDLNLQLFLEDVKRNRQVYLDFTALATNRNVVLFLKDHDIEVRDYLNMHVEPVIPQLPIEEEGTQIIKEKLRIELNNFLKDAQIEGKILEIYVDYLMAS